VWKKISGRIEEDKIERGRKLAGELRRTRLRVEENLRENCGGKDKACKKISGRIVEEKIRRRRKLAGEMRKTT
jgi:hypothetical protein